MKDSKILEYEDSVSKLYGLIKDYSTPIREQISEIEDEKRKYIIENKLYYVDLSEFNGKNLSRVTAIDSKGEDIWIPTDEIIEVENGKLYCSSYQGGIVGWNKDENSYYSAYYGINKNIDIIGFIDISLDEDD